MNILITGGTGFIGSALCSQLVKSGHNLVVKSRKNKKLTNDIRVINSLKELSQSDGFDVVINLAGQPIADKRWSDSQKEQIVDSRINTTKELIQFFKAAENKPSVFISGSAIGYYGADNCISDDNITEASGTDSSFSSLLCQQWEETALEAMSLGIRTCLLRTGIVLGKNGGALNKMLLPFRLGLGGRIGSGKQWMPWIHIDDMIGLIELCISNSDINGAINCTAPNPVTNLIFTKTLAKTVNRPAIMPMPAFVVKLLMGEMGEELLLSGKKVIPQKALEFNYPFKYQQLEPALINVINH